LPVRFLLDSTEAHRQECLCYMNFQQPDKPAIGEKKRSMNTQAHAEEAHAGASVGTNLAVWIGLVAITFLEVFLAYKQLQPSVMLSILVVLSVVKAAMIMSYFMHLKFEKLSLILWLIPAMIFCIMMMFIFFFPEAFRLLQMRPH